MARIDWITVATGAGGGLAVILPGAALSQLVTSRTGGGIVWLFLAVILTGFGTTGFLAGHRRRDTPMLHGALAAIVAFAIALLVGMVAAALRDRSISIVAVPLAALAAITTGVGGSLLADGLHRRARRRNPAAG